MTTADFKRDQEERRARMGQRLEARSSHPFTESDLLANLKAALPELEKLLDECSGDWVYEDALYRLYHHSFKVYLLQAMTTKIVAALQALAPNGDLNEEFQQIINNGTGRTFQWSHNHRWLEVTRPIAEAFFHARYFLEMAIRYGRALEAPIQTLPSGWAALLCLYDLR